MQNPVYFCIYLYVTQNVLELCFDAEEGEWWDPGVNLSQLIDKTARTRPLLTDNCQGNRISIEATIRFPLTMKKEWGG